MLSPGRPSLRSIAWGLGLGFSFWESRWSRDFGEIPLPLLHSPLSDQTFENVYITKRQKKTLLKWETVIQKS